MVRTSLVAKRPGRKAVQGMTDLRTLKERYRRERTFTDDGRGSPGWRTWLASQAFRNQGGA